MSTDRQVTERSEIIASVKQSLESRGATVEISAVLRGRSKTKHVFDIVIAKNGRKVPIDIKLADSEAVELREVLETYAKSLDTGSKPTVVVAVPAASSEARRSATAFGIILVEGEGRGQVVERLDLALEGLIG